MKILVLNCGSSSIKYQFIDMEKNANVLAKGLVERIGLEMGEFTHKPASSDKYYVQTPIQNHEVGIKLVLEALLDKNHGVITSLEEIKAVGHRVAHGGEYFKHSMVLEEKELTEIKNLCELAPLHNPANLLGIEVMMKMLPNVKQVGVFDTSFTKRCRWRRFYTPFRINITKKTKFVATDFTVPATNSWRQKRLSCWAKTTKT